MAETGIESDRRRARFRRYDAVAMLFHWVIAALILWQIAFGNWMADALEAADEATRCAAYEQVQLHKSIGLLVLALSVLRLAWRWARPTPSLPEGMSGIERWGARLTHLAAYALMIGLPLIGWALVSSSPQFRDVPTVVFGLFVVPHLPFLSGLDAAAQEVWNAGFKTAHATLAYVFAALLILHVLAALKHHLVNRDQVLARMVPGLAPRAPVVDPAPSPAGALGRIAALALLAVAGLGAASVFWAGGPDDRPAAAVAKRDAMEAADAISWWTVRPEESEIAATGANAGQPFRVVFSDWSAEIAFDPERLEQSKARVVIQAKSGSTGQMQYDGALGGADWLDVKAHPEIVFEAAMFRRQGGAYEAVGELTLKGVTKRMSFPFTLTIEGDRAEMNASLPLDRREFGVGAAADASGMAAVSPELVIELTVTAMRKDAAS